MTFFNYIFSNISYLDGKQLKFLKREINFSSDTLNFILDGTQICVDLPKTRGEIYNNRQQNQNENIQNDQNDENDQNDQNDENDQNDQNENAMNTTSSWFWNDASTKLLLDIYKCKKNLVSTRKIKTYKILWK